MWAFSLVPDAFLRFILIGLAHTLYRVRVVGRSNVPTEGGAAGAQPRDVRRRPVHHRRTDRPVRFVVYADYFDRPLTGRILRSMKAIPISPSGGPKMILQAFREAGKALDAGELVCLFPEGQLTRTGVMTPFQRGLERIVKGRTTPIIPVHLDRLNEQHLRPASRRRLPERIPYPVTVSIGEPLPPDVSLFEIRQAIRGLDQRRGNIARTTPAAASWVHPPGEKAPAAAGVRRLRRRAVLHQSPGRRDRDRPGAARTLAGPAERGDDAAGQRGRGARQPGGVDGRQGRRSTSTSPPAGPAWNRPPRRRA